MKTICAWCNAHINGKQNDENISHGLCEACSKEHFGFQPLLKTLIKDEKQMEKTTKKLLGPKIGELKGPINLAFAHAICHAPYEKPISEGEKALLDWENRVEARLAKMAPQEYYNQN